MQCLRRVNQDQVEASSQLYVTRRDWEPGPGKLGHAHPFSMVFEKAIDSVEYRLSPRTSRRSGE